MTWAFLSPPGQAWHPNNVDGREMHSVVYLSGPNCLLCFGGWTRDEGPVNETLVWENVTAAHNTSGWVSLREAPNFVSPRARYGHTAVVLDANQMLILGGMEFGTIFDVGFIFM